MAAPSIIGSDLQKFMLFYDCFNHIGDSSLNWYNPGRPAAVRSRWCLLRLKVLISDTDNHFTLLMIVSEPLSTYVSAALAFTAFRVALS